MSTTPHVLQFSMPPTSRSFIFPSKIYQTTESKVSIMCSQGDWSSQFKAEETALGNFYVKRDQIRMVKFMNQEGAFNYYTSEELQAHVVELPYQVA